MARGDFKRPSANAAAACTAGPESASAATSGSTARRSPIRPAASAAWRRTNGSGWRSASRHSAVSYTRVSAAASRRASSSTTPSSRGGAVADVDFGDGEVDALLLELLVGQPRLAHQLGAGAVEPHEVVGVVDHAHLVGLGIIDAQGYRADHAGAT